MSSGAGAVANVALFVAAIAVGIAVYAVVTLMTVQNHLVFDATSVSLLTTSGEKLTFSADGSGNYGNTLGWTNGGTNLTANTSMYAQMNTSTPNSLTVYPGSTTYADLVA
jgi:hypothetical protein